MKNHLWYLMALVVGTIVLSYALAAQAGNTSGGGGGLMGGGGAGPVHTTPARPTNTNTNTGNTHTTPGNVNNTNNVSHTNNNNTPTTKPATPADPPDVVAAREALDAAKAKLDALVAQLLIPFSKTPDYIAAQNGFDTASAGLKAARKGVLDKLTDSDEYKQALQDRADAKDAMHASASTTGEDAQAEFAAGETKYLAANTKLGKLEADAYTNDPATSAAQAKYDAAVKAVQAQTALFQDSLKQNADWQADSKAVTDAQANLAAVIAKHPELAKLAKN